MVVRVTLEVVGEDDNATQVPLELIETLNWNRRREILQISHAGID